YETFLESIPVETTRAEVSFIERQLPVNSFPVILDLCCGPGRHASALAERGYRILGVDVNERVVRDARTACPSAAFEVCDMRSLDSLCRSFDGVVNLWHSFGYFDDETNLVVLRQVCAVLRPGAGRSSTSTTESISRVAPWRKPASEGGGEFERREAGM